MNVLSLFDGISCGQLALQRANIPYDNYFASEIDKYAILITQKHFPKTIQLGDVIRWTDWNLPTIDMLIGGSPCQGFSISGEGMNFSDPRSKLFFKFVDCLKWFKPKYFLLENVRMKKEWRDVITSYLGVEPILINSALMSAQSRPRLYWTNIPNISQPEDKHIYLKDVIEHGTAVTGAAIRNQHTPHGREEQLNIRKDEKSNCVVPSYPAKLNGVIDVTYRPLLPIECERLQTLPDNYTEGLSTSQRYKCIGNGWTINVIAHIFNFIPKESL